MTEQTREAIDAYLRTTDKRPGDYLFPSRRFPRRPLTTRQYARLVSDWITGIGLDACFYGIHPLAEACVGIEVDDAIAIAEQVDV